LNNKLNRKNHSQNSFTMTQENNLTTRPIHSPALAKHMLIGAAFAFALMCLFLYGAEGRAEWGQFWMIRPLLVISFAGATGGAVFYFMDHFMGYKGGWRKALTILLSGIIYIFGLWIGSVLGLVGTLWN
jgi:hypothetical protein